MNPLEPTRELFARGPTPLRMPCASEREPPLAPSDYKVAPGHRWTVTLLKTGATIYSGTGPVEAIRSPALF